MMNRYRVEYWLGARKYKEMVYADSMWGAISIVRAHIPEAEGITAYEVD